MADNNTLIVAILAIGGMIAAFSMSTKKEEKPAKTAFNHPDAPAPGMPIAKNVPKSEDVAEIAPEAQSIMTHVRDTAAYLQQQFNQMQGFFESPDNECRTFSDMQERFPHKLKEYVALRETLANGDTEFKGHRAKLVDQYHQSTWVVAHSDWFDMPDKLLAKLDRYGMTFEMRQQVPRGPGNPGGGAMDLEGVPNPTPGEAHNAKASMAAARTPSPQEQNLQRANALLRDKLASASSRMQEKEDALIAHKKALTTATSRADKMTDLALTETQERAKDALERARSAELTSFNAVNPNGLRAGDLGDVANPLNIRDAQAPGQLKVVAQSRSVERSNERAELPVNPFLQAQPQTKPSALKAITDAENKPKKGAYTGNPRGVAVIPVSGQQDDGGLGLAGAISTETALVNQNINSEIAVIKQARDDIRSGKRSRDDTDADTSRAMVSLSQDMVKRGRLEASPGVYTATAQGSGSRDSGYSSVRSNTQSIERLGGDDRLGDGPRSRSYSRSPEDLPPTQSRNKPFALGPISELGPGNQYRQDVEDRRGGYKKGLVGSEQTDKRAQQRKQLRVESREAQMATARAKAGGEEQKTPL